MVNKNIDTNHKQINAHTKKIKITNSSSHYVHNTIQFINFIISQIPINFKGKLHFTTLNYALDYTLHHKLSHLSQFAPRCYFSCYVWQNSTAHDKHMFFIRCNNLKILKHPSSKSIKKKTIFSTLWCACLSPNLYSSRNLRSHPPHPSSKIKLKFFFFLAKKIQERNKDRVRTKMEPKLQKEEL